MEENNKTQDTSKPVKNTAIIDDFIVLYKKADKKGVGFLTGALKELEALKKSGSFSKDNKYLANIYETCRKRNLIITKEITKFMN